MAPRGSGTCGSLSRVGLGSGRRRARYALEGPFIRSTMRAAVLMSLRVPGQGTDKYDNVRIGMNARLDIIQAAVPSSPKSVNQILSQ